MQEDLPHDRFKPVITLHNFVDTDGAEPSDHFSDRFESRPKGHVKRVERWDDACVDG